MAGEKTDTGTGGINIDNNVYGMDVGVSDAEGGSQGQWSGGNISVDKSVKDISKPTKETFAKYMSKTTLGQVGSSTHPNAYPVGKGDGTQVEDYSIKTIDGLPQPLAETNNGAKFATVGIGVPSLQADFVKKGLSGGEGLDGNKLLPEAAAPADAGGPYVKPSKGLNEKQQVYLSEVIKKNRFNPSTNFEVQDRRLVLPNNLKLGVSPAEQEALGEETKRYTYEQLAHVGTILQLAATGEYAVVLNDDPNVGADKINPDDPLVALSTLLPGLGQLGAGAPLPTEYLKVERILEKIPDDPVTAEQLTDFNTKYEGVINSSFEKFSGFSSLGMSALVATLAITIVAAFVAVSQLFGSNSIGVTLENQVLSGKRLGLGNSTGNRATGYPEDLVALISSVGSGSAMEFFGILKTRAKFSDAVKAGVQAVFGLKENFAPKTTFESSGYLVTISRSIVRAVSTIVLQFIEIGQLLASANPLANVDDVFAKTLELISTIKNSRFVKCINIFAQIGDKLTFSEAANYDVSDPSKDSGLKISKSDATRDYNEKGTDFTPSKFYSKNRLNDGRGTLKIVWASNRVADAYILPARVELLSQIPGLGAPRLNVNPDKNSRTSEMRFLEESQSFRISPDEVRKIEDKFESEYLPFYIQDLRTNEIIGFHAFLSSLTDEYTANYDASEGIGRMDPIKIYKNTTRRVGVSFVLAALDEKDFDSMWQKINKLTTLVYPQYTHGKVLSSPSGDYVFEKPFTQMIGASPMVRLRVGNLFSSNYSKFNIAGIFGLRNPNAKINKIETPSQTASPSSEILYAPGNKFLLKPGTYSSVAPIGETFETQDYPRIFFAEIISGGANDGAFIAKISFIEPNQFSSLAYKTIQKSINDFKGDFDQIDRLIVGDAIQRRVSYVDKLYIVSIDDLLEPDDETLKKALGESNSKFPGELTSFLSEDNNAITRSFKTTSGRGLAGFIDNISFDWNSATWDVDPGRKAPKMCKITLGFTPIHDISPGIDAYGYNRAPIYPLGPFARKDGG